MVKGNNISEEIENLFSGRGAIILCKKGWCKLQLYGDTITVSKGRVLVLFPWELVSFVEQSPGFKFEMLIYDNDLFHESCIHIEGAIFHELRHDRFCKNVTDFETIISKAFDVLWEFYNKNTEECFRYLLVLQLKSIFAGYAELSREEASKKGEKIIKSPRVQELFSIFMTLVAQHCKHKKDVQFYADKMNISDKYLVVITKSITKKPPKVIIGHYVALYLRHELRTTNKTIGELSMEYGFSELNGVTIFFRKKFGVTPTEFRKRFNK